MSIAICILVSIVLVILLIEARKSISALEATQTQLRHIESDRKEFLDMIAHQIRTPLGSMRACLSMLAQGDMGQLPPHARASVTHLESVTTRLLSVAETFLQASRVEGDLSVGTKKITNIVDEVSAIVSELLPQATKKGIRLEHVEDVIFIHPVRLNAEVFRNAVFNLVDNAVKYTNEGRVSVHVYDKGNAYLACDVRDTGIGLTKQDIETVFTKFTRVQESDSEGVGLGLYVVKRLVEASHGVITVASEGRGQGSIFHLELPFEAIDGALADG